MIGVTVAGGIGLTLLVVSLNVAFALGIDLLFDLPVPLRVGLLVSVPVTAAAMIGWTILRPWLTRYQNTELAAVVEAAHPELRERLLSLVELQEGVERGEEGGSELMRSLLLQETMEFAKRNQFADVVDATRAVRRCWLGGMALFALLLPLIFATNAYAVLLSRFMNPWGNYERLQNLMLLIDNADRVVGRGDDVRIVARPRWRFGAGVFPEAAWLEWTSATGTVQTRRLDWYEKEQLYSVVLPRVDDSFDYRVAADGVRTRQHHIEVVDRPDIIRFAVDITPPAYTGAPAQHQAVVLGEFVAIEQSQLELQLTFNKPLVSAEILWLEGELPQARSERAPPLQLVDGIPVRAKTTLPLSGDGLSTVFNTVAALDAPSGRFVVRTVDEHGLQARVETVRRFTVQPDLPPLIDFADNEQHASARPEDVLRIPLQAADDFGLATVQLHYEIIRNGVKESGIVPVPADQLGVNVFDSALELDLNQLKLTHGMQVALRARATDHRPVPGPNETWTGTRLLQIQNDARPYGDQTLADTQHRVDQAMDNLKSDIEKQRKNARQLQAEAQADETRQEPWRGDEKTAAMEDKIRELAQQMQKLSAVLDQQPVMQPLADEARNIAERELAQAAANADEARQAPLARKQQKLSDAADRLQKAEEQLKKIQEKHQSLAQTQRDLLELNRLAENTEQLAEQVDQLTRRQLKNPPVKDQASSLQQDLWNQDHQRLVTRHEQLERDLDHVLQEHPELLEHARENLQNQLAAIGEQADRLSRQQHALANSSQSAAQDAAHVTGLRQQQDKLLREAKQLAEALKLPTSEDVSINGAKESRAARQSLERGDFAQSREQHQAAEQQLSQLAQALKQNETLPQDSIAAVQALQKRQQKLMEQLEKLPAETTPESRAKLTELAAEQVAIHRATTELPQTAAVQSERQQTLDRLREAGRSLAENHQSAAREQARQADESLGKLAETLTAAVEDPAQQTEMQSAAAQRDIAKERARSQELQQQAEDLAHRQEAIAAEIANKTSSVAPPVSSTAEPATAEPKQAAASPATNTAAAEKLANLADAQQAMAQRSRQLGEETRHLGLNNDQIDRASAEFPNVARAAAHELGEANFQRAAEMAREAAEKSQKLAETLAQRKNGTIPERLQAQVDEASQQQKALAEQLQALADSPDQQTQFRAARQQQLHAQTEQLTERLSRRAEQLGLEQLDRKSQSETARQGEAQLSDAGRMMQQSIETDQSGNHGQAAEAAKKSAESLKQAAQSVRQASQGGNPQRAAENSAQGEAGQQVAESAQYLHQAGEQLAQLGQPARQTDPNKPGNQEQEKAEQGTQPDPQAAGEKDPREQSPDSTNGQQGQGNSQSVQQSEESSSAASQSLREAAKNMREAAQQMGLAQNSQRSNKSNQNQPGRNTNESTGTSPSESASDGEAHLQDLEHSLGRMSNRNWGKLPGNLQSELIESAQRRRDAAYGNLIRRYFEDISRTRPAELNTSPAIPAGQ